MMYLSQIGIIGALFVIAWSLTELLAISTAERFQQQENKNT